MGIAMFVIFLLLLVLGVPVIFVLGLTSAIYMIVSGMPLIALAQRMFVGMDSFVLMAIPFYVLVGNLMSSGDITRQIVKWCRTLVYLINGNMLPLRNAGAFADTQTGKEENPDEEVLEVEEPGGDGDSSGSEDAVLKRHHRRGKLV